MQQTILALGALLIIMMTAINHQRSTFLIQKNAYVREIESAAEDVVKKRLEILLNSRSFDESTTGGIISLPSNTSGLTAAGSLGNEAGEVGPTLPLDEDFGTFNDVDDVHNYQHTVWHVISTDTFRFQLSYSVQYLDASNNPSMSPTFAKEISATAVSQDTVGAHVAQFTASRTAMIADDM